jgi:hypothetical protein
MPLHSYSNHTLPWRFYFIPCLTTPFRGILCFTTQSLSFFMAVLSTLCLCVTIQSMHHLSFPFHPSAILLITFPLQICTTPYKAIPYQIDTLLYESMPYQCSSVHCLCSTILGLTVPSRIINTPFCAIPLPLYSKQNLAIAHH